MLQTKKRPPMISSVNPKGVLTLRVRCREGKGETGMKKVPGLENGPGTFLFGLSLKQEFSQPVAVHLVHNIGKIHQYGLAQ
jgi:hypothetical protein